ncbi:MAG: MYXO-CTERM sorting domain-containing protein [Planctomycetota bacterium]
MKKKLLPALALTAAAVVLAPSADAGSSYALHGKGGLQKTHTFNYGDVDITAHATSYDPKKNKTYSDNVYVGQYGGGLGVTNSVKEKSFWGFSYLSTKDGSHTVDGKGMDDTLWLSFSNPFKLAGAAFTHVGKYYEDVKVVDGDGNSLGWFDLSQLANKWGHAYLDLSGLDYTGDKIGFAAVGNGDSWKVKSVKGHVVPTPSAAAAGLLGLAALSARRRRHAEADAE